MTNFLNRDGDDGWWSTFHIQVGTPGQTVRLLPGTSASAGDTFWVVIDEGCTVANPTLPNCANERGYLFHRNLSTSWSTRRLDSGGLYSLTTFEESYLGLNGNAYYGFDTVNLGLPGSGLPTLHDQVVAGYGTNDFWLGSLGLSPIPFNLTNLDDPQPSMLSTLYNQSLIPSLSWSYTAGAHYQDPPALGSLTLGGFDSTRFIPNNVTTAFGADFSRDLLIELQAITYDTIGSSPLLTRSVDVFIDSMVTHMYLPLDVCHAFERAFNLTWNNTIELYTLDEATHDALVAQSPTFRFTLGNGSSDVEIVFPYAAFDLNISRPLTNEETRYFPLKQALNSSQYTLGRVFLQEAYMIADYDRQTFSISQALFPDAGVEQDLVPILTPGYKSGDQEGPKLNSGSIAGIAVAAVATIVLIVAAILWRRSRVKRRRAAKQVPQLQPQLEKMKKNRPGIQELDDGETMVRELDGWDSSRPELEVKNGTLGRYELTAPPGTHELRGHDIVISELEASN